MDGMGDTMRGVILAGGTGSRLGLMTRSINKHLLPVYDRPMIMWPLKVLRDNGIEDITIVSSPDGVGQIARLLGSGHEHGCRFTYRVQDQPGGIAQALECAMEKGENDIAVILGDNVFVPSPTVIECGEAIARVWLVKVPDLSSFGVPSFRGDMIESVIEKPTIPPSKYAITGLYVLADLELYHLRQLTPSSRGELEITDILNFYAKRKRLQHSFVDGFWGDAGTIDGMAECSEACRKAAQK